MKHFCGECGTLRKYVDLRKTKTLGGFSYFCSSPKECAERRRLFWERAKKERLVGMRVQKVASSGRFYFTTQTLTRDDLANEKLLGTRIPYYKLDWGTKTIVQAKTKNKKV